MNAVTWAASPEVTALNLCQRSYGIRGDSLHVQGPRIRMEGYLGWLGHPRVSIYRRRGISLYKTITVW